MKISRFVLFWFFGGGEKGNGEVYHFLKNFGFEGKKKFVGNVVATMMCYAIYHNRLSRSKSYTLISGICRCSESKYFCNNWFQTISETSTVLNFS